MTEQPTAPVSTARLWVLLLCGVVWQAACLWMMRRDWLAPGAGYDAGLAWQMLAALPLALWFAAIARGWTGGIPGNGAGRRFWCVALAGGIVLRLLLLDLTPRQSDDIFRYIWEGRMHWHGFNPFRHAPSSGALAHLRDETWPLINHPQYPAIYPPLAQWVNALAAGLGSALGRPVIAVKLAYTLCDLGVFLLLRAWLRQIGRCELWALLWLFHPLVIVEFAGNGHLDSLVALLLTGGVMLGMRHGKKVRSPREVLAEMTERSLSEAARNPQPAEPAWEPPPRRAAGMVLFLTGAILAKIYPFLLLTFFARTLGRRGRWLAAVPVLAALAYLPYASAGAGGLLESLSVYAAHWSANSPLYDGVIALLDRAGVSDAYHWARLALPLGLLMTFLWLYLDRKPLESAVLPMLGVYLIAGPVIHPWYLTVLIPLVLALARSPLPWLWLTTATPLYYLSYTDDPGAWFMWAIWLPFFALLGFTAIRGTLLPRPGEAGITRNS